ncbi:MAG: tetratricopeptide repeat protein [Nevskia sp.]|nr:tetratricopeptide repeat protein [Nevskia sp.]
MLQAADAGTTASATHQPAAPSREAQAQYHILAGEVAAGRKQPQVAAEEFIQALDFVSDPALAARATMLALSANDAELSLTGARKWLKLEPTSLEAREVILRLALRAGLVDDSFQQCMAIVADHPGGPDDGFRHVALLLSQEEDHAASALLLMERLVATQPKRSGAWHAQGLLALRFNDVDLAERSAREALRLDPGSKEAPLLLTGVLVRKGDYSEADRLLENQVRNSPIEADLRLGYTRLLIEANQKARARKQLKAVLKHEADNTDAQYMLGLLDLDDGRLDDAEARFRALSTGRERGVDSHYYLGRIAERRDQFETALKEYTLVNSGQQVLDATIRRATMLARLGRLPDARATLEQLREQYPQVATRLYVVEGQLLGDAGELDEGLRLYSEALKIYDNEPELLYSRSLINERLLRLDDAEADLRAVLVREPADARALNALGFMLAVHGTRLDEAERLIVRALELTPQEPSVIDSMGWLRFRQGRANEAVALLSRAYEVFPDPEVAAHFGEALWATGDRERAQQVWSKALETAPDHPVLRETIKRLMP